MTIQDTKIHVVWYWVPDALIRTLIDGLGPMPKDGWPLLYLLDYFAGFDIMINHKKDENMIRLFIDIPGGKFTQR